MKLWIAIYHHRHGTMTFPLWCEDGYTPTEADALSLLDEFEPGERVDIDGPGIGIPNAPNFGAATGDREPARSESLTDEDDTLTRGHNP